MIKCLLQVTGKAKINENLRVEVLAADEEEEEDKSRCLLQEVMSDATFKLHKWHSNCPDLEEG